MMDLFMDFYLMDVADTIGGDYFMHPFLAKGIYILPEAFTHKVLCNSRQFYLRSECCTNKNMISVNKQVEDNGAKVLIFLPTSCLLQIHRSLNLASTTFLFGTGMKMARQQRNVFAVTQWGCWKLVWDYNHVPMHPLGWRPFIVEGQPRFSYCKLNSCLGRRPTNWHPFEHLQID